MISLGLGYWRLYGHIPALIIIQIIFIILFGRFVIYSPLSVSYGHGPADMVNEKGREDMKDYPMFQDVHVMIFIGFGFLMTFLKKYGLSAVSLNMLCAVIAMEWATLVLGFFHLHYDHTYMSDNGTEITELYPGGVIYLDMKTSMLVSDFAAAAVLISFGAVIGTTSPLQLIVMTLFEIVFYTVNEVIGRTYLGAIDAGDSIFVHQFGAYFGLAVSRALYTEDKVGHKKQSAGYTSDLFSMVGTIFLWMYWPSFNAATAVHGEAQQRAVLNTYFSLCGSVFASFAMSAFLNEHNKFVMEHIQNATLAGGVAIGAVADLFIQPYGALIVGSFAGAVSVLGFEYLTPFLVDKLKIHDTCGVHNLHGIPGTIGMLLGVIMASMAGEKEYTSRGLKDVYPALVGGEDAHGHTFSAITNQEQARNQILAGIITFGIAIVGGLGTGFVMKLIGRFQALDAQRRPGSTVVKLALNIGNVFTTQVGIKAALPKDAYFDDNLFFVVHPDDVPMVPHHGGHQGGGGHHEDKKQNGSKVAAGGEEIHMKRLNNSHNVSNNSIHTSHSTISSLP